MIISVFPLFLSSVKVISLDPDGTWEFGVEFRRGKGRSFNTYTRGYLRRGTDGRSRNVWAGRLAGMPDPMDPDAGSFYEWVEYTPRVREWLKRKIAQAIATGA